MRSHVIHPNPETMPDLPLDTVKRALLQVLREGFEGPASPRGTWFVENAPDSGIFGTLDALSAEEASRAPAPGRPSAAAHAEHLRFSLDAILRFLNGEMPELDWPSSWRAQVVNAEEWSALREALRARYGEVKAFVKALEEADELRLAAVAGTAAHAAYHLGAIRQVAPVVRNAPVPASLSVP